MRIKAMAPWLGGQGVNWNGDNRDPRRDCIFLHDIHEIRCIGPSNSTMPYRNSNTCKISPNFKIVIYIFIDINKVLSRNSSVQVGAIVSAQTTLLTVFGILL